MHKIVITLCTLYMIVLNHCTCVHMFVNVAVIQPPKSQVALSGKFVNYICQGDNTIEIAFNTTQKTGEHQAGADFLNKGINFMLDSMGDVSVYNIIINASILNNGTSIYCVDNGVRSMQVYIYAVEGKA